MKAGSLQEPRGWTGGAFGRIQEIYRAFIVHILQCIQLVPRKKGGVEYYLVRLATRARERGWRISYAFGAEPHADIRSALEDAGAEVHVLSPTKTGWIRLVGPLLRLVRRDRPDLIVGQFYPMSGVAVVVGFLRRIPSLKVIRVSSGQFRMELDERNPAWMRPFYREKNRVQNWILGRLATRYMTVSKAVRRDLHRHYGVPAAKIDVLYNGVDTNRFAPRPEARATLRNRFGLSDKELVVFTAAMARPQKRIEDLLQAVHVLRSNGKSGVVALHAGGGPLLETLLRQAEALHLGDGFRFLGYRTDIPDLLAGCDVFVLPSNAEPCSRALLEAMASGCAIVATDVEGNRELLQDGECGLLVPAERPDALAEALERLLADPSERARLADRARARAVREFDQELRLAAELDLYSALKERA